MYRKSLTILVLLFFIFPLFAQDSEIPLIAYFNQQIYRLEGNTLVEYDACTPDEEINGPIIPSPDGTKIMMGTFPPIISEALDGFGSLGDAPYSVNVWLCDTATDTLERVIAQEGGDDPFEGEIPPIGVIQSRATWSPNSMQLAWTELSYDDNSQSVMTLDLATGEETSFVIDVPLAPFPAPPEVIGWTDEGLLMWVFEFDEETFFNIETLVVANVDTQEIMASYEVLNGGETDDFYNQRELIQTPDGVKYALEFELAGWVLVDIATGELEANSGLLAMSAPENPDSLKVQYEIDFSYNFNWQIINSDVIADEFLAYPPERITLSPDGTQIAYADSTLHILNADGTEIDVSNSDGFADDFAASVIWGRNTLVFVELDETQLAPPNECEGTPPIRVIAGDVAFVISPTISNRIRSEASTNGNILGEIPGGGEFVVRDGPVCGQGYTWFQIEYNGILGWTVEGTGGQYFIEPVSDLP